MKLYFNLYNKKNSISKRPFVCVSQPISIIKFLKNATDKSLV